MSYGCSTESDMTMYIGSIGYSMQLAGKAFMTLAEFFKIHSKFAVAFSGGVDSSYLVYAAAKADAKFKAYCVKSSFQPLFELENAEKSAAALGIELNILNIDIFEYDSIIKNDLNRCYCCKRLIFETVLRAAKRDGFSLLIDGTNASDNALDRPGMRAADELKVLSPLRECALTKDEVRRLSRDEKLITADKPSYSCLATRIKTGEIITAEKLKNIEAAERFLFSLGFLDFRVRLSEDTVKLQFSANQYKQAAEAKTVIMQELGKYFPTVLPEFEIRR